MYIILIIFISFTIKVNIFCLNFDVYDKNYKEFMMIDYIILIIYVDNCVGFCFICCCFDIYLYLCY